MKKYSTTSQNNLDSADPRLILIFTDALNIMDHSILDGYRTEAEQLALFLEKKTKVRLGKHNVKPSMAVDALPYPIDYEDKERMCLFAGIVLAIAHKYGVKIRWGRDWDGDTNLLEETFLDYAHFEIVEDK
jgi:peptidoglycan L-alanyl-D-glutamate endopeptidase CwlK